MSRLLVAGIQLTTACAMGLVVACGLSPTPSDQQVLARSLATLRDVTAVKVAGTAVQGDKTYTFTFQSVRNGDAEGGVDIEDAPLVFVRVGGMDYLSGEKALTRLANLFAGSMWVSNLQLDVTTKLKRAGNVFGSFASPTRSRSRIATRVGGP